jgi:PmbA protein
MSYLNFISEVLDKTTKAGATEADIILFDSNATSIDIRHSKLENIERSSSRALGIRAFVGNKYAIVSSSNFSTEDIAKLAEKVVEMAKVSTEDQDSSLADSKLYPSQDIDLEQYDSTEPEISWLQEQALKTEAAALDNKQITNSEGANISHGKTLTAIANTKGFIREFYSSDCSLSVSVIAGKDDKMERDYDYSTKIFFSDLEKPEDIGKSAAERTISRLNPRSVKTDELPVIFDSRVASSIIACLVKSINGASIVRGTSFLKDKMHQSLFSKNINIIDDPLLVRGLGSRYFDAEAVATKKLYLIKDGILQTWLLDSRSAKKLGLTSQGHASRSISSPPRPTSSNVYLANGSISEAELIKTVKKGVYITELSGMGINLITGDYSQGACGYMIENGKITYPISEFTIASNLINIFQSLTPANNLNFKNSINSPTIKIEKMTVAGN